MPNILKTLAKLLSDFKNLENSTPVDFVESGLKGHLISQDDSQHFLCLARHEMFLQKVADHFVDYYKLRWVNKINVKVLLYFVIFVLDQTNYQILLNVDMFYITKLLTFVTEERNHLFLAKSACTFFENNHVLEKIMYPLLDKVNIIQEILECIEENQMNKIVKKPVTVPKEFDCFKNVRTKSPNPPVNTPDRLSRITHKAHKFRRFSIPVIMAKLEENFDKNRERARMLLEEAQKVPQRLTEVKKEIISPPPLETKIFKAKKLPRKKNVEIKSNLTSTLREASRLTKVQENEIKKIEDIIKGGSNAESLEQIEMELRQEEHKKAIEDIERKHLQSLLTYEEAILAKQKLFELNKQRTQELKETKAELMKRLDDWRNQEQEKIKILVEKSQKIRELAKISEQKLYEERQDRVRMLQFETRELLKASYEEKQKELARKAQLIQEIRTLHQIRCNMNVKEFDPSECPNFGLLCEMSILELQERLALTKIKTKEELDEKRKNILKKKEQQQEMLENVKNFITQTRRMSKIKLVPICKVNLERSPDLDLLKKQLEEKRSQRLKATKST